MQPEVITTMVVGVLLAMFTAILAWQGKGRFDALQRQISGDITSLDKGLNTKIDSLKSEQAQIRAGLVSIHSTLVQVALAVGSKPRPEAG